MKVSDIDWESMTIAIWGEGSKQRRAPFTAKSGDLLMHFVEVLPLIFTALA